MNECATRMLRAALLMFCASPQTAARESFTTAGFHKWEGVEVKTNKKKRLLQRRTPAIDVSRVLSSPGLLTKSRMRARVAGQAPGCPALRESPAANANVTPRECFVLFDRHVHKNGGSTMSVLMQRLEEQGECLYWGYHLSSLQRGLAALRGLSRNSPRLPRLCIDGHVGGDLAGTTTLESLKAWQRKMAEHGLACHLFTTLRVREPLSHYVSFYLWSRAATRASRHRPSGLGDEGFLRWANSTPNLQANILLHPAYADFAEVRLESRPASAPSYLHAHVQDGDSDASRERMRQLVEHFDLSAPLERFDEALLMTADALGLRYLQHARIDPECLKLGGRAQRVQLDEAAACTAFSAAVRRCFKRSKGCAPERASRAASRPRPPFARERILRARCF